MRFLRRGTSADVSAGPVTTLELFFDLVFVFTITQLTAFVGVDHGWPGVGRTALLLALMWWMYGGYAWLTNAAPPVTAKRRVFLLLGMTGNFVTALAIPHAFGDDRLVFAAGYLLVVAVHAFSYLTESSRVTAGMVLQLLGWNVLAALLVLLGAILGGSTLYLCWLGAVLVEVALPRLAALTPLGRLDSGAGPSFEVQPGHFVERHGLMLIIVLGESVLAIGVGVGGDGQRIGASQVLFAAISLGLASLLYWAYFGTGEDDRAEHALEAARGSGRQQELALASYGYAFFALLLSVIALAAGLHHALAHPLERTGIESAVQLAGGVAGFWVGLGLFRLALERRDAWLRLGGGVTLLASAWLGTTISGLAELVGLLAGCVLILTLGSFSRRSQPLRGSAT